MNNNIFQLDLQNRSEIVWLNLYCKCKAVFNIISDPDKNAELEFWTKKFQYDTKLFDLRLKLTQAESNDDITKLIYKIRLDYHNYDNADTFFNGKRTIFVSKIINLDKCNVDRFISFLLDLKDRIDKENIEKINMLIKQYQLEELLELM